jgi:hypothetical protein
MRWPLANRKIPSFCVCLVLGVVACQGDRIGAPLDTPELVPSFTESASGCSAYVGGGVNCGVQYSIRAQQYWPAENAFCCRSELWDDYLLVEFSSSVLWISLTVSRQNVVNGAARVEVWSNSGIINTVDISAGGTFVFAYPNLRSLVIRETYGPTPTGDDQGSFIYSHVRFAPDCAQPSDPFRNKMIESAEVREAFGGALKVLRG